MTLDERRVNNLETLGTPLYGGGVHSLDGRTGGPNNILGTNTWDSSTPVSSGFLFFLGRLPIFANAVVCNGVSIGRTLPRETIGDRGGVKGGEVGE